MTKPGAAGNGTHVAFLLTGLGLGGAELQAVRIAVSLKERGYRITVVSMLPPQRFTEDLSRAGIPLVLVGMRRGRASLRNFFDTVSTLRQLEPDVLVCFMYHANLLGRLAGFLARVPRRIVSVRNENFGGRRRELVFRWTNRLSAATVVNSERAANSLVGRRTVSRDQLTVIPNGIEIEPAPATRLDRTLLGVPEHSFLWLVVGRLEPQKDHDTLFEAFANLDRPDHHLLVAGDGSLMDALQLRARELGIASRVHFMGHVHNIRDLMFAADALVLSSAWEGLPNVIMEAFALGRPVVATDVGGVRELVMPGKSGFIVPARSGSDLKAAMIRLSDADAETRRAMGEAGKAHVAAEYGLAHIVDRWEELIVRGEGRR